MVLVGCRSPFQPQLLPVSTQLPEEFSSLDLHLHEPSVIGGLPSLSSPAFLVFLLLASTPSIGRVRLWLLYPELLAHSDHLPHFLLDRQPHRSQARLRPALAP